MELAADFEFFGFVFAAHWNLHAWLMVMIWIILIPGVIVLTRFGKPPPSPEGIPKGSARFGRKLFWFTAHRTGLFLLVIASVIGGVVALVASGGVSGTLHGIFGVGTIGLALLQLLSARLRGTHGGRDACSSGTGEPTFSRGDHYDMSPHRRWFEACHKILGYFTLAVALAAVATGLSQYWLPGLAIFIAVFVLLLVTVAIVLDAKGYRHDTYLSNFGTGRHHPFNKARIDEMSGE
jgi:MFS family permease